MTVNLNNTDESGCSGWNEVFENIQLRKRLIGFAELRLPVQDKAYAEDIYQQAMLNAFEVDPNRIDDKVNYLIKIVQNLCYDQHTRPGRLSPALTVLLDAQHNEENKELLPMQIPDPKRGPALDAEVKEQNEKYLRTLALHSTDLTEREKELLRLHLCGFTNKEIAVRKGEDVKVIRADMNAVKAKIRYRVQFKKGTPAVDS
jgi:DNA-directed RNA polymerase specialized sigma24 family protein